jgi:hypothetical protein
MPEFNWTEQRRAKADSVSAGQWRSLRALDRRLLDGAAMGGIFKTSMAALAFAAITAIAAPANAEPAAGQGVGTYTCAEAAKAVRKDRSLDLLYFSWAQGWMTGWNLAQMNIAAPTVDLTARSLDDQQAFIKSYCVLHPDGLYMDAVHQLYSAMKPGGG